MTFVDTAEPSASLSSSHDTVTPSDYHLRRMLLGVPEGPAEIVPEAALPLESCMDVHGGGEYAEMHCAQLG